ncbi:hypothetical protein Goshw_007776, partial [Gossypium schwendimanii]|nr:hypothetical protein [Gossypium schwendimanii]MBA0864972.1 hypothetical protein [Gossypium schwendimanii]
ENFEKLNEALAGSDHSWTALTLEIENVSDTDFSTFSMYLGVTDVLICVLCTALETANKLVQSTDTNVRSLSEKVRELEKIVKRGDSAITAARAISISLNQKVGSSVASENRKEYGSPQ